MGKLLTPVSPSNILIGASYRRRIEESNAYMPKEPVYLSDSDRTTVEIERLGAFSVSRG